MCVEKKRWDGGEQKTKRRPDNDNKQPSSTLETSRDQNAALGSSLVSEPRYTTKALLREACDTLHAPPPHAASMTTAVLSILYPLFFHYLSLPRHESLLCQRALAPRTFDVLGWTTPRHPLASIHTDLPLRVPSDENDSAHKMRQEKRPRDAQNHSTKRAGVRKDEPAGSPACTCSACHGLP